MQVHNDTYGNVYLTFPASSTLQEVCDGILANPCKQAILLRGVSAEVIQQYNALHGKTPETTAVHQKEDLYLIRGNANCPEIVGGQLIGAGASIIVYHQGEYYALYQKDKSRPLISSVGGSCNRDEYEQYSGEKLYATICRREVREETEGKVIVNGEVRTVTGLQVPEDCTEISSASFPTKLFGLSDIPDCFHVFSVYYDTAIHICDFLQALFDDSNRDGDHYTLKYVEQSETEYIHAVRQYDVAGMSMQLSATGLWSETLVDICNTIRANTPTFTVYADPHPTVSIMAQFYAYMNLCKIKNTYSSDISFVGQEQLQKMKFPPHIKSLSLSL